MILPAPALSPVLALALAAALYGVTALAHGSGFLAVFIAGLVDNLLKPILLGRGVAVPMPVVLIGALGGMISGGVIGLFIGPVALAVAYQLFWQWVEDVPPPDEDLRVLRRES